VTGWWGEGWSGKPSQWVERVGVELAEQYWTSSACGAAGELERALCDGVSGTALGKEPGGDTNAMGEMVTQGEGFRRGKGLSILVLGWLET
jgi:hypothetical protein